MTKANEIEMKILELATNYDDAESQKSDNYSDAIIKDIQDLGLTEHQVSGYVSQLKQKGLIFIESIDDAKMRQDYIYVKRGSKIVQVKQKTVEGDCIFYMTDKGIDLYYSNLK